MPSNVKVAVRIRPLLKQEEKNGHTNDKVKFSIERKEIE